MRFWVPILNTLFAAAFILKADPTPVGMMAGFVTSVTGVDIAARLCKQATEGRQERGYLTAWRAASTRWMRPTIAGLFAKGTKRCGAAKETSLPNFPAVRSVSVTRGGPCTQA